MPKHQPGDSGGLNDSHEFLRGQRRRAIRLAHRQPRAASGGYPVETVSDINRGKEHATAAGNLSFVLVTNQVFSTAAVSGYPGMSGGPLCVQYTNGTYYPAGVFLGGSDQTIVRAIDGDVADLINRADVAANTGNNNTGGGVLTITPGQGGSGLFASLDVTLGPPAALAAGGGWRVQGDSFYPNYHTTTENLVAFTAGGTKTLEFKQIPGWDLVAQTNITLALGQKTIISALYTQTTSTAPPPPAQAGGQPNLRPGYHRRNGCDLPLGVSKLFAHRPMAAA